MLSSVPGERSKIPAPVGMYNLGNTCFQSAVLQCLIACIPIQKYFLYDIMHHHASCLEYRKAIDSKNNAPKRTTASSGKDASKLVGGCLACELDKLILRYLGSARGVDVFSAVTNSIATRQSLLHNGSLRKGSPLVTAEILTSAWNCGGMNHLAGYDQRDAHEFLHGFLDNMGKHDRLYRNRIATATGRAAPNNNGKDSRHGTFPGALVVQSLPIGILTLFLVSKSGCRYGKFSV